MSSLIWEFQQGIRNSILELLQKSNEQIEAQANRYQKFAEVQSGLENPEFKKQLVAQSEVGKALRSYKEDAISSFQRAFEVYPLTVHLICNAHRATQLYTPLYHDASLSEPLQSEILLHIKRQLYRLNDDILYGSLLNFRAFETQQEMHARELGALLSERSPYLSAANVNFELIPISFPLNIETLMHDNWKTVPLNASAIDYALIPLRIEYENLFPELDAPFTIISGKRVFEAHVTSQKKHNKKRGNYICSNSTGDIRKMYSEMGIASVPASLEFTVLKKDRTYVFRKKK